MGKTRRVTVADVEQGFEEVVRGAASAGDRVIVEKDGREIAEVTPLPAPAFHAGQRIAEVFGMGGEEGEAFARLMEQVVRERATRPVRDVPIPDAD